MATAIIDKSRCTTPQTSMLFCYRSMSDVLEEKDMHSNSILAAISLLFLAVGPATAQGSTAMPADPDDPQFREWRLNNWNHCIFAGRNESQQRQNITVLTYAECVRDGICIVDWTPPLHLRGSAAPMAPTPFLSLVDDAATVPSQVIGIPDICTKGIWVEGTVPPECLGPIKDILIQSGRALK